MGVCIDISRDDLSGYETIPQMYIGLGIRSDEVTGLTLNSAAGTGPIDISVFQEAEAMQCFNQLVAGNGPLSQNVNDAVDLVEYFRARGNLDGETGADTVTDAEIEAYVNTYINTLPEPRPTLAAEVAGVRNTLVQFVALVRHVSSTEAPALPETAPAAGTPIAVDSVSSYETISHMYIGLGIRRGSHGVHLNAEGSLGSSGVRLTDLSTERLTAMAEGNASLVGNIRDTRALIDAIEADSRFNADNDATVVSDLDLQAYCRALARSDRTFNAAEEQAGLSRSINALRGLIAFMSAPPPAEPEPVVVAEPDTGLSDVPDAGPHVIAVVPIDAGPGALPVSDTNPGGGLPSWAGWLGLGIGASVVTGIVGIAAGWMMRGGRNNRPGGSAPAAAKPAARTVAAPPPQPPDPPSSPLPAGGGGASTATNNPPNAPSEPAGNEAFLDDIDSALAEASSSQSPGVARASGGSTAALVTADNVLIEGPNAAPVTGLDPAVIEAQVVLHYRGFLSQTAREHLEGGRPLPADTSLVNTRFEREVSEIVDSIVTAFHRESAENLAELWENQRDRGYLVRRGVPERFLIDMVDRYIERHSSVASSPFSGGEGAAMRSEAAREVGEQRFLRDGMREIMRFSGR
ncbi:MAG TPA: hypothetical protein VFX30_13485 [bacterium]|nr:hypothetical protein [bacterium]